jgi:hypothetical protein
MRKIAEGKDYLMPATIDDPAVLSEIARAWKRPVMAPWLPPGIGSSPEYHNHQGASEPLTSRRGSGQ